MAFVPVEGVEETDEEGKKAGTTETKPAKVLTIVNDLLAAGDLQPNDIGVISPYNGQVGS